MGILGGFYILRSLPVVLVQGIVCKLYRWATFVACFLLSTTNLASFMVFAFVFEIESSSKTQRTDNYALQACS